MLGIPNEPKEKSQKPDWLLDVMSDVVQRTAPVLRKAALIDVIQDKSHVATR